MDRGAGGSMVLSHNMQVTALAFKGVMSLAVSELRHTSPTVGQSGLFRHSLLAIEGRVYSRAYEIVSNALSACNGI
jgi:hypothetical protein